MEYGGPVLRPYEPTFWDRLAQWAMGDGRASPERRRVVEGLLGTSGLGDTDNLSIRGLTVPETAADAALMAIGPAGKIAGRGAQKAAAGVAGTLLGYEASDAEAGVLGAGRKGGRNIVQRVTDAVTQPKVAEPIPTAPGELRASTRFPTAAKATEDPIGQQLTIGAEEIRRSPTFAHNMSLLGEYPGFAHLRGLPPEEAMQGYIQQARGNLNYLWDNAPQVMRDRSPLWYDGANNFSDALAGRYGIPRQSSSAAIAALSPQMDWFKNASLAERVGDVIFGPAGSKRMTSEMEAFARSSPALSSPANAELFAGIAGKRFSDLTDPLDQALWIRLYDEAHNPRNYRTIMPEGLLGDVVLNADGTPAKIGWGALGEIEKAVRAYQSGGDMSVISPMLGTKHKVRSFYNNIELPNDLRFGDVTADTHQVAAAQMRPLSGNTPAVAHNLASGLAKNKQPAGYMAEKSSAVDGVQGTYGLTADATRAAAADQGLIPRQMQSGTWEPVRELFPSTFKNAKNVARIDDVWRARDAGEITLDDARRIILDLAGGIGEPSWARRGVSATDPRRGSSYR